MGKKNTKKQTKKVTAKTTIKKNKSKNKLYPGKKYCKNCKDILAIHQKVCTSCGHVH